VRGRRTNLKQKNDEKKTNKKKKKKKRKKGGRLRDDRQLRTAIAVVDVQCRQITDQPRKFESIFVISTHDFVHIVEEKTKTKKKKTKKKKKERGNFFF
jgi:hypothetical protein